MFMNYISQRKVVQLVFFILLLIIDLGIVQTGKATEQHIIAVVEGISITDKDVSVNRDIEYQAFKLSHGRKPSPEELSTTILKAEQRKLIGKINSILRENTIRKFGITVSTEEARAAFKNLYPGLKENPDEVLERERSYFQKLYLALKEANENPQREREIFELKLKDIMEYETWQRRLKYYNTPEKLEMLKKMIPESIEDIYKSGELGMKGWVLNKKFEDSITKDIKITDVDVQRLYESRYMGIKGKPKFEEIKSKLQQELLRIKRDQKIGEWWKEKYKKAKIEIKDVRFKDVLNILVPSEIETK